MFKKGDKVFCVDAGGGKKLTLYKTYVIQADQEVGHPHAMVSVIQDKGRIGTFYARRFVLVPNIQVGDKVKVVRKIENAPDGRTCLWANEMGQLITNAAVGVVKHINQLNQVAVEFPDGEFWTFLPECLEVVAEAAPQKAKPKKKKAKEKNLRAALREKVQKLVNHSICSYALEFKNKRRFQVNDVCHFRIRWGQNDYGEPVKNEKSLKNLALSLHGSSYLLGGNAGLLKMYKKYADYIIKRSPWAQCFATQDTAIAFRYGIYMDVSKPVNWIAGAVVALREGVEFPDKLRMFNHLVKNKVSERAAFLISYLVRMNSGGDVYIGSFDGNHTAMYGAMCMGSLVKFFNEGYTKTDKDKPYSEYGKHYEIFSTICPIAGQFGRIDAKDSIDTFLNKNLVRKEEGEGWRKKHIIEMKDVIALGNLLEDTLKGKA